MTRGLRNVIRLLLIASGASIFLLAIQLLANIIFHGIAPAPVGLIGTASNILGIAALCLGMYLVTRLSRILDVGEFNLEQALEEVRKLTQVIDATFDGIVLTDTRGVIRHVNPKWTRITGWSAEETEGKMTPAILKSGYQNAEFYTKFWLTIQNGNQFRGELINKRKDGGYYLVDEIVLPIKDKRERVTGYAAFHHVVDPDYTPTAKPPITTPPYTEAS